jgi:hypothetical protein
MRRALAYLLLWSPIASVIAFIFVRNSVLDALKITVEMWQVVYLYGLTMTLITWGVDCFFSRYRWWLPAMCLFGFLATGLFIVLLSDGQNFWSAGTAGLIATAVCSLVSNYRTRLWPSLNKEKQK